MTATKKPTPTPANKPPPKAELGDVLLARGPAHFDDLGSRASTLLLLAASPEAYAFYRWDNIAINVWASQPTGEAVKVLAQLTERSLSECPSGLSSIHWLEQGVALPTAEARQGLGEIAKRYEKHLICVGVMLQGSGFWASATRSALSGIVLLAPRTYSLRFYGEVSELSAFVARAQGERAHKATDAALLRRVIEKAVADATRVDAG